LLLSAQNPNEWLYAAFSLISNLDHSPNPEGWTESLVSFLGLNPAELDVLKEWLLYIICDYDSYRGWGIAASGPGETFGRAFDTISLLQKEVERRRTAET
jgi:hypothetical protein